MSAELEKAKGPAEGDRAAIDEKLATMEKAFEERGDPRAWDPTILEQIDECFKKNFFHSGTAVDSLFFPEDADNINRFARYCTDVKIILRDNYKAVPRHAQTYFAYSMLWRQRGYKFPMPLGTATVIQEVHNFATKYRLGLAEVSKYMSTCLPHCISVHTMCTICAHYVCELCVRTMCAAYRTCALCVHTMCTCVRTMCAAYRTCPYTRHT